MAAKRKSLAEELAELVDPAPLTFDPEHTDLNEATVARLADYKEEGSEEGETAAHLRLRAGAALQELSEDPRYSGRAVSRRSLEEEEESGECTFGAALVASGYSNGFDLIEAHSCDVQWIVKMMSSTAALINDGEQEVSTRGSLSHCKQLTKTPWSKRPAPDRSLKLQYCSSFSRSSNRFVVVVAVRAFIGPLWGGEQHPRHDE